jgi:predicted nucleotidyltransferase component of viral defense system
MRKPIRNIGASVRARLLNLARERNQPFDLLLTRYAHERLLYRLSTSKHRDRFILKGAMLMAAWLNDSHRPTRDVDLLSFGDFDPKAVVAVFQEIGGIQLDDAVTFSAEWSVDLVRGEPEEGGLRIKTNATVDRARLRVVIDIGFGDAIEPGLSEVELPVLLDRPAPRLRAYARETVIAEKFQAMVVLGRANSRMKDLYDIWMLARSYEFRSDALARAIAATFSRRKTAIPAEPPDTLSLAFAEDPIKLRQWSAFVENVAAKPASLRETIEDLANFLMPHVMQAAKQERPDD